MYQMTGEKHMFLSIAQLVERQPSERGAVGLNPAAEPDSAASWQRLGVSDRSLSYTVK